MAGQNSKLMQVIEAEYGKVSASLRIATDSADKATKALAVLMEATARGSADALLVQKFIHSLESQIEEIRSMISELGKNV